MKTLSLKNKKDTKEKKAPIDFKYPTPKPPPYEFKHFTMDEAGARAIGLCQHSFESFWKQIEKIECTRSEKKQALIRLKEACNWMSRGIAMSYVAKKQEDTNDLEK